MNRLVRGTCGLIVCLVSGSALAGTIHVTDYHDVIDDADGSCTLREAIRSVNTGVDIDACGTFGSGDVEILLSAGTYNLDLVNGTAENLSEDGDLDIRSTVSIRGVSAEHTIIDGNATTSTERVFDIDVASPARVQLRDLTVTGGSERSPGGEGGNVRSHSQSSSSQGTVALIFDSVVISNGFAATGGGLYSETEDENTSVSLRIDRSRIESNTASLGGGGVYVANGTLLMEDSVVERNSAIAGGGLITDTRMAVIQASRFLSNIADDSFTTAAWDGCGGAMVILGESVQLRRTLVEGNSARIGGGICWVEAPQGTVTHSAVVSNTASETGGGIYVVNDVSVRHSTIAGNSAASGGGIYANSPTMLLMDAVTLAENTGGGLFNEGGAVLEYSLLAGNVGGNCQGTPPVGNPYNLDDANTCAFPTDDPDRPSLVNTDPILGPLQHNGGGLPTLALLPGSPAIDAFDSEERQNCHLVPDQRTYARGNPPVLGDGSAGDHLCDIGAYEFSEAFVVNSTDDTVDSNLDDGICADVNGNCTLRAAVMQSDAVFFFNEIELGAGTHALTLSGTDEDRSLTGDLDINDDVLIRGVGVDETIIDGAALDRIIGPPDILFDTENPRANLIRFEDLTLQNGAAPEGGAIIAWKPMELERVALRNNSASAGTGGAIRCIDNCDLSIVDSTVDGNSSTGNGGAIYHNSTGRLTVDRTTFSDNSGSIGGALETTTQVHARNSTFSGNSAGSSGAMFANSAVLENATITGNSVTGDTGGVFILNRSAIVNSIISNNLVGSDVDNCSVGDFIVSIGSNLSDTDAADCGLNDPSDLTDTDPLLGPLTENGGPTLTHLPLAGSTAIDAGDNDRCPAFDQRGLARTGDCDLGSVDASSADVAVAISAMPNPVVQGNNLTLTIAISNSGPADAAGVAAVTTLPAELSFVSGTAGTSTCTEASGVVTCQIDAIVNGDNATASIVATTSQSGTVTVPVDLSTSSVDSDTANNSAEVTVTIDASASGGGSSGGGGGSLGLFPLVMLLLVASRRRIAHQMMKLPGQLTALSPAGCGGGGGKGGAPCRLRRRRLPAISGTKWMTASGPDISGPERCVPPARQSRLLI